MIESNLNKIGCFLLALFIIFQANSKENKSKEKLNFIIIFTDDQGYNDLGCYGSPLIKTPNIDKLAEEGIKFTNFYAQPVCGPSRTALMTGCYPLRVAEVGNKKLFHPFVHPQEVLLPELLNPLGYKTGCIGKWDLNGHKGSFPADKYYPTEMGFDYWYGLPSSNDGGAKNVYRNKKSLGGVPMDSITQLYTREALDFIKRNKNEPFFLYIPHSMPHTKLGASDNFKGKSAFGLYGDAVEEIDWSVGEIINQLKKFDLDKNTVVIFTSDNGPWAVRGTHSGSAFPLRGGKTSTWEGGVRVPCVIWAPSLFEKGVIADNVISTMDIFPTVARLSGAALPDNTTIDGQDISKLLLTGNDKSSQLNHVYFYYYHTHLQAVRKGDWKLVLPRPQAPEWIRVSKKGPWKIADTEPVRDFELYNLKEDMGERRNIAAKYPGKVNELKVLIEQARNDIGDYNKIGKGARFFEKGARREEAIKWQEKEANGWKQEIEINQFYDDGTKNKWF